MALKCSFGYPNPLGSTPLSNGVNFALFSKDAFSVFLCIFKNATDKNPSEVIQLDSKKNKTGDIWHIFVEGLSAGTLYLFKVDGPNNPEQGLWFDKNNFLLDPYAKAVTNSSVFNSIRNKDPSLFPKCIVIDDSSFDWENDISPQIPLSDSIFYELHVRGYTKSVTANVKNGGTYSALIQKIPYLKELGITAVELLPVFNFDENENDRQNPVTCEPLKNFWGYSTINFFAPKTSYAADSSEGGAVNEFKQLVKEMHKAGIEVILDVVFNHTAEGNHLGPTLSFRGIANDVYYILDDNNKRYYKDFTGCGNTMNCNHPVVMQFILDCLHYWVLQMHVDGFRFDLASVFCRSEKGDLLENPFITHAISEDPILKNTKIIAEPWDAAGAYHTGRFPGGRWCSWNDRFRDAMRRFMRGEDSVATEVATRLAGSSDLYASSGPDYSINFITVHDGFTLYDLVSYTTKHNEENGENNRDGTANNYSYNSGIEGFTKKSEIISKRMISIKNLMTFLVLSQGVPLLLAGDEFCRTQKGNNNAYCQDNEISWIDWTLAEKNKNILHFVQKLIELRKNHFTFRRTKFFKGGDFDRGISPDIVWYNESGTKPNWSKMGRFLACRLDGNGMNLKNGVSDCDFYFAANMNEFDCVAMLPPLNSEKSWRRVIDTSILSDKDICSKDEEEILSSQKRYVIPPYSIVLLLSKDVLQNYLGDKEL